MNNHQTAARRTWRAPEILSRVAAKDAQIGNDSMLVDQGFPAANGLTPHFNFS